MALLSFFDPVSKVFENCLFGPLRESSKTASMSKFAKIDTHIIDPPYLYRSLINRVPLRLRLLASAFHLSYLAGLWLILLYR